MCVDNHRLLYEWCSNVGKKKLCESVIKQNHANNNNDFDLYKFGSERGHYVVLILRLFGCNEKSQLFQVYMVRVRQ